MTPRSALRSAPLVVMALVVAILVSGIGYAFAADGGESEVVPLGPGDVTVEINIHYSRFQPERLVVAAGTRVRFLVVNDDPIFHELITGGPEVHRRHANGTEAQHPSIPGEVTVGPNEMAITTFTFDEAGTFEFACHLPGHYEYGMRGEIEVVPPSGS
ncbi:MAG TPA: cupredoxin domain-containing protein [Acidimicrobiia bacterium]|nr:cupredoxin domain-containing protein [Acidimicrobiia bacterium]